MLTYSDWRLIAPIPECPECSSTELRSRDHPEGIEIGCRCCSWSEVRALDPAGPDVAPGSPPAGPGVC